MENEYKRLKKIAIQIRRDIIEIATFSKGGAIHVGPALSCTDIVTALYFKLMRVDPSNPNWEDRDRFILSKGHAYAVIYSALAEKGFFPREELMTARALNSRLQGHPVLGKTPGIDMVSGSLGNGLSCGAGIATALKLQGRHACTYVILGDGELQEGMVWEAAMYAGNHGLDTLTAIVDCNHFQSCGSVNETMPLYPLADKWRSFGWQVMEMNGHDMPDILRTLSMAKEFAGRPVCVIAHTVKGKGISFIEHNNKWHAGRCTVEQHAQAMKELNEQEAAVEAGLM